MKDSAAVAKDRADELLTSGEVAETFRVHVTTVGRWARKGFIRAIKTPTGIYRYRRGDVEAYLGHHDDDDEAAS